jgi:hypothetical protein
MRKKNLADYYPVYKDITDQIKTLPADLKLEYPFCPLEHSSEKQITDDEILVSPVMLNAEELADLALKCGFTSFQTILLLVKNAFEGHAFLNYQIRPTRLFHQGTILLQAKPELILLSFYEQFLKDDSGHVQIEKVIREKQPGLTEIKFDQLIQNILINPILRLPVSVFAMVDILKIAGNSVLNTQTSHQRVQLFKLGERIIAEYEIVDHVNQTYAEKFKEHAQQFRLKEEVFSHYLRKLALAFYPDIHTEEQLDELMYKKLLEEKLLFSPINQTKFNLNNTENPSAIFGLQKLKDKIKILYRLISKNCAEIHTASEAENKFPILTQIFMEANTIYNESVICLSEAFLHYQRMILLLSKLVIYRKTQELKLPDSLHLLSEISGKEVLVTKDEFRILRKDLDITLVAFRIKSFTDYKLKFVTDDEFEEIHNHFLKKQIEFIDEQILQIQSDITEILKQKSQDSMLKPSKN